MYFTPFELGKEIDFLITKENMVIYNLFDDLYKLFKEGNVFQVSDYDLLQCNDINEKKKLYKRVFISNQELKNSDLYKKVFDNEKIIWISDDSVSFDYKTADSMTISNEGDYFKLRFTYYGNDLPYIRSIRIQNVRSRYKPFNGLMMDFYNNLQMYDPNAHQMQQEKPKQLIK